jgi:hypothetical protein
MKKLIITLAIVIGMASMAQAATATWTHNGVNTTGYTLYFWQTATPSNVYNKSVTGSTVRTMTLDDNYFQPGVSYSFTMTAYNATAESVRCPVVMFTRPGQAYQPPADNLPSIVYVGPSGVNQIVITLP